MASELTGLPEGTAVAGGAGDQAAGAVGNGIVKPGVISSTIGTSGVVLRNGSSFWVPVLSLSMKQWYSGRIRRKMMKERNGDYYEKI
jgi:hypothetical protein